MTEREREPRGRGPADPSNVVRMATRRRTITPEQERAWVRARFATANPCPNWCDQGHGHPYRNIAGSAGRDARERVHSGRVADLTPWAQGVDLIQVETADDSGRVIDPGTASVVLAGSGDAADLDPAALRAIALRLVRAADKIEHLIDSRGVSSHDCR